MLSAYFLPLWHILLDAPQYPEGLEMKIWLNGLSGNIDQINGLNHYIGMKFISVDDFKEFKILPYVFGALTLVGLAAAIVKAENYCGRGLSAYACLPLLALATFICGNIITATSLTHTPPLKWKG